LQQGTIEISIGEQHCYTEQPVSYFIALGQFFQVLKYSLAPIGYALSFDTDYFLLCLKSQVQLCFYLFFQMNQQAILLMNKTEDLQFNGLLETINYKYNNRNKLNDDLLVKLYLNILLIKIERLYELKQENLTAEYSRKHLLTAKFKKT